MLKLVRQWNLEGAQIGQLVLAKSVLFTRKLFKRLNYIFFWVLAQLVVHLIARFYYQIFDTFSSVDKNFQFF